MKLADNQTIFHFKLYFLNLFNARLIEILCYLNSI